MDIYGKFAKYYDLIYDGKDYGKEGDMLEKVFTKFCRNKPKSILDVGCGTGSHALILSRRGYNVTGIDLSPKMVEIAKKKALREKSKAEFFVQDMREIDVGKKFDCAICMFGGFGYIFTYSDFTSVFSSLKRHLVKHGLFIYEFWSVGGVRASPYQTWTKTPAENITLYRLTESNFDAQTNILNIDMHFILTRKNELVETFSETHRLRCYTLAEMKQYLEWNEFELTAAYDSSSEEKMEFESPEKESFRILAIAKKN